MGAWGTRPSFSGLEVWVSGCGFAQLPNHLTTEPPNQRLGTDPKFPVCVTLPRRSIVRERAGSAASARRQGRCDGCIFMAGIISKNQSARQARSCPSLAPTRKRREDIRLDNAGKFHLKFTVAVPEIRAALHDASASRIMLSIQLSKNDSSPPSEKKPFYIIPGPAALTIAFSYS